jgi:hypothetical protein
MESPRSSVWQWFLFRITAAGAKDGRWKVRREEAEK